MNAELIFEIASAVRKIPVEEIKSRSKEHKAFKTRCMVVTMLLENQLSPAEAMELLGYHPTAIYKIQRAHSDFLKKSLTYRTDLAEIRKQYQAKVAA